MNLGGCPIVGGGATSPSRDENGASRGGMLEADEGKEGSLCGVEGNREYEDNTRVRGLVWNGRA